MIESTLDFNLHRAAANMWNKKTVVKHVKDDSDSCDVGV